jgi:glutathione S-transferase
MWTDGEAQKGYMKVIKESFALLEAQLEGKRFFGGDTIGLVDIAACGFAHWLGVCEEVSGVTLVTDDEFPRLRRWAVEYVTDEKIRACLPDRAVLLEHFSAKKEMFMAMAKSMLPK